MTSLDQSLTRATTVVVIKILDWEDGKLSDRPFVVEHFNINLSHKPSNSFLV
jgi:hypothetical protein